MRRLDAACIGLGGTGYIEHKGIFHFELSTLKTAVYRRQVKRPAWFKALGQMLPVNDWAGSGWRRTRVLTEIGAYAEEMVGASSE
jgi:hypothetical protein